jgi:hypothetical protein
MLTFLPVALFASRSASASPRRWSPAGLAQAATDDSTVILAGRLALTEMHFGVDASGSSLRVGMRNAGNQIIRETGVELEVTQDGRSLLSVRDEIRDFITGSAIFYPAAWRGQLKRGSYRVTGLIRPQGGPPVAVDQTVAFTPQLADKLERKTGQPAVPVDGPPTWIWIAIAVALAATGSVTGAYVRLRSATTSRGAHRVSRTGTAVCTASDLPLARTVRTASEAEANPGPLIDAACERGFALQTGSKMHGTLEVADTRPKDARDCEGTPPSRSSLGRFVAETFLASVGSAREYGGPGSRRAP